MKSSNEIDLDTVVAQTEGIFSSELDGETVLMGLTQAAYFGLDSTGQIIWNMITEPCRVGDLCDQLAADYDVERSIIELDVFDFLNELNKEGLIQVVSQNGS
jgi:hypothetical protein